jgi:cytochrome c5
MKLLAALLLLTACVTVPRLSASQLAWASTKWPDATAESLEHGRALYVSKCGGCHVAPEPAEVLQTERDGKFQEMADRAHLSDDEKVQLLKFVEAAASPGAPGVASLMGR